MESDLLEGGCFCGQIRYRLDAREHRVVNCHCTMCRRTSGAPFVTWIIVPRAGFAIVHGSPRVLHSSPQGQRQFCGECGSPITFTEQDRPHHIDVTTCTLDAAEQFPPTSASHTESKLAWLAQTEPTSPDPAAC